MSSVEVRSQRLPPVATDKSHHVVDNGGFVNPWPSWTKPSLYEFWSGLSWWDREEVEGVRPDADKAKDDPTSQAYRNTHLQVTKPDFESAKPTAQGTSQVRTWWLGHAGVLVEFPAAEKDSEPFRILFDPIFSQRCSPSQYWGPTRFYPAPCQVADLPPVHLVLISHNHYDHLDADTISKLWQYNREHIRFVLPLGNMAWMKGLLGPECVSRVWEADWWDSAFFWKANGSSPSLGSSAEKSGTRNEEEALLASGSASALEEESPSSILPEGTEHIKVICTPAQHGSGRYGLDTGSTLWASYHIFFYAKDSANSASKPEPAATPFHIFFGGDTGYRLRPPPPSKPFPPCPAFQEMHEKLGVPDLLLLPISVGSTYSYIKSWDPIGVMPLVSGGLTAQNHLDEWEALDVARVLCGQLSEAESAEDYKADYAAQATTLPDPEEIPRARTGKKPVALAIHFGTFSPPDEAERNLRALRRACGYHSWRYTRSLQEGDEKAQTNGTFVVLDHGCSIDIPLS